MAMKPKDRIQVTFNEVVLAAIKREAAKEAKPLATFISELAVAKLLERIPA